MGIPMLLFRRRSFSTEIKKKIGILRETKNRWECRVPLTPENIKELREDPNLRNKLEFYIQPSRKRIFQDDEYIKVNLIDNAFVSINVSRKYFLILGWCECGK